MPNCPPGNFPARICDLEEAVRQLLENAGHPPVTLTNNDAPFAWNSGTQVGNIPVSSGSAAPAPEVVLVADAAARAALAPTKLNSLLIQASDAINGNYSIWSATGLTAGDWTLKVGSLGAQNASNVSVTGGSITGITDLAVADGGTGGSTPAAARQNLNIGTSAPAASNIDWLLSDNWFQSVSANTTYTFSNLTNGMTIVVAVAAAVASTVAWPAGVLWPGGSAPAHSGVGKTDVYTFHHISGRTYGSVVADYTTP